MRQLSLFSETKQTQFGGSLLKGRRKSRRPLSFKNSHHLVLKSDAAVNLLGNRAHVNSTLRSYGARFGVKIYSVAVHMDHIHMQIFLSSREGYVKWIRAVTSVLVQKIQGLKFSLRPWTRIVAWGRAFRRVAIYLEHNRCEGEFLLSGWKRMDRHRNEILEGLQLLATKPPRPLESRAGLL